jgi:hypothetical protein
VPLVLTAAMRHARGKPPPAPRSSRRPQPPHLGPSRVLAWMWAVASLATGCDLGGDVHSDSGLPVDSVTVAHGPEMTWDAEPLFVVGAADRGRGEVGAALHLVSSALIRSD